MKPQMRINYIRTHLEFIGHSLSQNVANIIIQGKIPFNHLLDELDMVGLRKKSGMPMSFVQVIQ